MIPWTNLWRYSRRISCRTRWRTFGDILEAIFAWNSAGNPARTTERIIQESRKNCWSFFCSWTDSTLRCWSRSWRHFSGYSLWNTWEYACRKRRIYQKNAWNNLQRNPYRYFLRNQWKNFLKKSLDLFVEIPEKSLKKLIIKRYLEQKIKVEILEIFWKKKSWRKPRMNSWRNLCLNSCRNPWKSPCWNHWESRTRFPEELLIKVLETFLRKISYGIPANIPVETGEGFTEKMLETVSEEMSNSILKEPIEGFSKETSINV